MKNRNVKRFYSFLGYLIFFLTIAVTVMVAILIYDKVSKSGDSVVIAIVMLIVIAFLSLACTVIDAIRRKIMVERPVEKILDATERIAAGDFSVRINTIHPYEKYDDYDLIIENLNMLAEALSKSEILKTDFISNVSHELKTPLSIIQNYVTLIQDESLDAKTRSKHAKTILNACKKLTALITNILKLNKLENQGVKPDMQEFNLTEALAQTVLQFEDIIESKSLQLDCDFDDVTLFSSESYLEIVWNNLLSNAIKFTEEGGKISVLLKKQGSKALVQISDTGCGISPETGAKIFEKFYQGDTSHSQEGNGLGLALVKKVIDVLGGEISVQSQKGKGSTFSIILEGVINE